MQKIISTIASAKRYATNGSMPIFSISFRKKWMQKYALIADNRTPAPSAPRLTAAPSRISDRPL